MEITRLGEQFGLNAKQIEIMKNYPLFEKQFSSYMEGSLNDEAMDKDIERDYGLTREGIRKEIVGTLNYMIFLEELAKKPVNSLKPKEIELPVRYIQHKMTEFENIKQEAEMARGDDAQRVNHKKVLKGFSVGRFFDVNRLVLEASYRDSALGPVEKHQDVANKVYYINKQLTNAVMAYELCERDPEWKLVEGKDRPYDAQYLDSFAYNHNKFLGRNEDKTFYNLVIDAEKDIKKSKTKSNELGKIF